VSKSIGGSQIKRQTTNKNLSHFGRGVSRGEINSPENGFGDQGDLSRYFSLTAWSKKHFPNLHNIAEKTLQLQDDVKKTGDLLFVCKTSVSEKNAGLDGFEKKDKYERGSVSNSFEGIQGSRKNPKIMPSQNTHPTTKPIALYNYLLEMFSKSGDIILDPFCGSGVTPIACVLTNRKYIGIDISEEYCAISRSRIKYWLDTKNKKNSKESEFLF